MAHVDYYWITMTFPMYSGLCETALGLHPKHHLRAATQACLQRWMGHAVQ